jgi:apolipoprotein N-acyltransferase
MPASDAATGADAPVIARPTSSHPLATTIALAATHAALFTASFPPFGLWPLAFVSLVPLALAARGAATTRRLVLATFFSQYLLWMWLQHWMGEVTTLGYPAFALYLAIWPTLAAWLLRRASRSPAFASWPAAALLPVIWVGVECLRGELAFDGYPWYLLGHPLIDFPLFVQSADLLGSYFIGFLAAAASGLVVDVLRGRAAGEMRGRPALAATMLGGIIAANLVYGAIRLGQGAQFSDGPRLLLIQTNLPQSNKIAWEAEQRVEDLERFLNQTVQAHREATEAGTPPDLVVWPETMFPGFGLDPDTVSYLATNGYFPFGEFAAAVARTQAHLQTPMLIGSPAYENLRVESGQFVWDAHFNSAYLVAGDPPYPRYDKFFLTPFGETMPYISSWPWLESRLLALGASGMTFTLESSPDLNLIPLAWSGGEIQVATPICFEDTVARVSRRMVHRGGEKIAGAIVNLSNDGWFGEHDSGRAMHAQVARFRCIENRVPMVRAANTGYTVSVDSSGKVIGRIGSGRYGQARQAGTLLTTLRLDPRRTLFSRIGDAWAWACLAATGSIWILTLVRRPHG